MTIIPPYIKYGAIALVVAVLVSGAAWGGYVKGAAESDLKLAQFGEQKAVMAADYERRLGEKKVEIVTEYVDKLNTIKEKEIKYVTQATSAVPNQSELPNGWVYLHDASARAEEPDRTSSSDASPSGVADNQALATVVTNYALYGQCVAQVKGLQDLITEHNKAIDEVKKKK